jgi:hypothetical protein
MTEINKNNEKLDLLIQILTNQPESIDILLNTVLAQGKKKKPKIWRGRELTLFPNGEEYYLTPSEQKTKKIIDELVKTKKLSNIPSEATMNKFYSNSKIRTLSKKEQFWGKHYFKQNILDWSVIKKK